MKIKEYLVKDQVFICKELPASLKLSGKEELAYAWLPIQGLRLQQKAKQRELLYPSQSSEALHLPLSEDHFQKLWAEPETQKIRIFEYKGQYQKISCTVRLFQDALNGLIILQFRDENEADQVLKDSLHFNISYDPRFEYRALSQGSLSSEDLANLWNFPLNGSIGAIPYLANEDSYQLVVCTTQKGDRWIFPKGQPKDGVSFKEIALIEAGEETGLIGEIKGKPILCSYNKGGNPQNLQNLLLFPMEVHSMLKLWQENELRQRLVSSPSEIRRLNGADELEPGLCRIEDFFQASRAPAKSQL